MTEKSFLKQLEEHPDWNTKDCGIQHGCQVKLYYPKTIKVTLIEEKEEEKCPKK